MPWFRTHGLLLILCLAALPASAKETSPSPAEAPRVFHYGAWVGLAADGQVVEATLPADTTLPDVLRGPLVQNLKALVLEPARPQGVAKPSRSWLQGNLTLVPKGDDYQIIVDADQLGPRLLQPFHPRMGRPPDQPVRLLMQFEVTAEGRVRDVQVTAMDRPPSGMIRRVEDSLRVLRFEPEQVDGQPVATTLRWPFQSLRENAGEKPFDLPPLARDPQRPGVPGQDAYAMPIIFTAVFRGSITIPAN